MLSDIANGCNPKRIQYEETMQSTWKIIEELFHSDNVKEADAALDVLFLNLGKDETIVYLLKHCLNKATAIIPACDQVTKLSELAELTILHKTLYVIVTLTHFHEDRKVGIAAIGGVEAIVKVMKTFPKCQALQKGACGALRNLTCYNVAAKKKVVDSGGIELVLAAINNHLGVSDLCQKACMALFNIVSGSKENTELLMCLGGATAVAKVRHKWTDNHDVQRLVRLLAHLIVSEMKAWAGEE